MANDFNDLNNPIGAVPAPIAPELPGVSGPDPYHSNGRDVYSKYGHRGEFSSDNPAYQQFLQTENKQDAAALYEQAVQWEIDKAKIAVDKQLLDEQREYDSPSARLARDRQAGINSDIVGSGSGSGSGSGTSSPLSMSEQEITGKFGNYYDDERLRLEKINTVFSGINTASSLIGSLAGGYSSIISGISQLKTLPSQIALNEANAGLANVNANEVNALLDGKKRSLDLDNISKYLGQVSGLQGLLKNGFTDEEGTNLFNTLGIPSDQQAQLMASIRGVHQNPDLLAKFHNDNLNARRAKWNDKIYDDNTVESFTQLSKQIEFDQLQFQYADAYLKQSVMNALMYDEGYQSDLVDTALNIASTQKLNSDVVYQNAVKDCEAWGHLWDEKKAVCDGLKSELEKLKAKAEEDGKWTDEEIGNYCQAWIKFQACKGSLSNEFSQMRGFFIDAMQKVYERNRMLTNSGKVRSQDVIGAINYFSRINFDSDYDNLPSGGAIAREWFSTVGSFARDAGVGAGALLP